MSARLLPPPMSVDEFLVWADGREGHYELETGAVIAMAPERLGHTRGKSSAMRAFADAISRAGLACEAFMDGPGVPIDAMTSYQPDAVVHCGRYLADDARLVETPVIILEILSPSTAYRDLGRKLRNYFRVPSIIHYLVVDIDDRIVTHHRRSADGSTVTTAILADGTLALDPPGILVGVEALLPPLVPPQAGDDRPGQG